MSLSVLGSENKEETLGYAHMIQNGFGFGYADQQFASFRVKSNSFETNENCMFFE